MTERRMTLSSVSSLMLVTIMAAQYNNRGWNNNKKKDS